jgi:D-tyrosyl-tRNA(Tyr) deacylase
MASKLWGLRIMDDEEGVMNLSLAEVGGGLLVISQFTLYADTAKGRRPSYAAAATGAVAEPLVGRVVEQLRSLGAKVAIGSFGAEMLVELANDGPVTLIIDT